jgi:predicted nucleic acid-binding protein
MGVFDEMIAAHALALELTLLTGDRAFERVPGLHIENWLE